MPIAQPQPFAPQNEERAPEPVIGRPRPQEWLPRRRRVPSTPARRLPGPRARPVAAGAAAFGAGRMHAAALAARRTRATALGPARSAGALATAPAASLGHDEPTFLEARRRRNHHDFRQPEWCGLLTHEGPTTRANAAELRQDADRHVMGQVIPDDDECFAIVESPRFVRPTRADVSSAEVPQLSAKRSPCLGAWMCAHHASCLVSTKNASKKASSLGARLPARASFSQASIRRRVAGGRSGALRR